MTKNSSKNHKSSTRKSIAPTTEIAALKRQLEVEAALERIRARTMAMQHSDELADASLLLAQQVKALGIETWGCAFHIYDEGSKTATEWFSNDEEALPTYKLKLEKVFLEYYQAGQKGESLYIKTFEGKACQKHYQYLCTLPVVGEALLDMKANGIPFPIFQIDHVAYFKYGHLLFITFEAVPEAHAIFLRMAAVFEQTYTRFLDLKKAEEQAREAQIEAALERVRARTMAMHKGDELADTALLLFDQITELGIKPRSCGFLIMNEQSKSMEDWSANINELGKASLVTGTLTFDQHPIISGVVDTWKKGKPYFIGEVHGKELQQYYQAVTSKESTSKTIQDQVLSKYTSEWTNSFYFDYGMMYVLTPYEISKDEISALLRFARVFKLTYRRFLDLKKAEEQAREAEIELALERVRARTMAMQHSNELPEAANLLFQQVQGLGMPAWSAGYCTWDEDMKGISLWMSSEDVIQPKLQMPLTEDPSLIHFLEAHQRGETFFAEEIGGEELVKHYEYLRTLPGVGESLDEIEKAGFPVPTFQIFHLAYFSKGFLLFITYEPVPEAWDIFKRFGRVFEQTYTRFLDLKKAEEQARESQIEAALERVRAGTMAMHKSSELGVVVKFLYQEMSGLGLTDELSDVEICIIDEDTGIATVWQTDLNLTGKAHHLKLPFKEFPLLKKEYDSWKKTKFSDRKNVLIVNEYSGKTLKQFIHFLSKIDGWENVVHQFRSNKIKKWITNNSYFNYGMLTCQNEQPLSIEGKSILARFSAVFEQTYTRFLDLKKAEEQAREAQIEASLERVRAKAMAMHSSEDLTETVGQLFKELKALDISLLRCGVGRIHKDTRVAELFTFTGTKKGEPVPVVGQAVLSGHPVLNGCFEHWKKQKEYHPVLKGTLLEKYYQVIASDYKLPGKQDNLVQYGYFFPFSVGMLFTYTEHRFSEEELVIFRKFSSVMGLTYRRFLDLKEAEEQAREAQIEAALEKIRNRTLLMKDSSELNKAVAVFFQQFQTLGLLPDEARTYFCHINAETDTAEVWMTHSDGTVMPGSHHTPLTKSASMKQYYEAWKEGEPIMERNYKGKALKDYLKFVSSLPHVRKDRDYQKIFRSSPKQIVMTDANFLQGNIGTMTFEPLSQEAIEVLVRFAKVFEFTYTRFLDLKKAEEQAREAQIEASLERVRAKAMAMHSSEDLSETVEQLFKELKSLDISLLRCGVGRVHSDTRLVELFAFTGTESKREPVPVVGKVALKGHPVLNNFFKHWKEQKEYHFVLKGANLRSYHQAIKSDYKLPGKQDNPAQYGYFFPFPVGLLYAFAETTLTEEELFIFRKFSSVVGLTYRRFLDLTEAEAQAREAQIEAALERVRAASLAMHKTDELGQVVEVLFQQFSELDLDFYQVWINIFLLEEGYSNCWFSPVEGVVKEAYTAVVPLAPFEQSSIKSWKAGKEFSYLSWKGRKEVDKIMEELSKMTGHPSFRQIQKKKRMDRLEVVDSNHKYGVLAMAKNDDITDEDHAILRRFTKVFEQTYTRFLDLQKAEAQAREAQIEAALERVRARAMAMHKSSELAETSAVLFDQFMSLGIEARRCGFALVNEDNKFLEIWSTGRNESQEAILISGFLNFDQHPLITEMVNAWRKGDDMFTAELHGKALQDYYKATIRSETFADTSEISEKMVDNVLSTSTSEYYQLASFDRGMIYAFTEQPLEKDTQKILTRFATAFELTYRRFLDLKKAEEQTVEAQIEAALERVRSAAAAMHSSEDLFSVAEVLHIQLAELGQRELESSIIHLYPEPLINIDVWYSYRSTNGKQVMDKTLVSRNSCSWARKVMELYESDETSYLIESRGKMLSEWYQVLADGVAPKVIEYDRKGKIIVPEVLYYYFSKFSGGALLMISSEPPPDKARDMQRRAAAVFDLAYRRFLDLQKAEARTREAQIEAALERVRASTMAMHSSDDVIRATSVLFKELVNLGIETLRCGIVIINQNQTMEIWGTSTSTGEVTFNLTGKVDMTIHPLLKQLYKDWKSGKKIFSYELKGKDAERYYNAIQKRPEYGLQEVDKTLERHFSNGFLFDEGAIFAFTKEPIIQETAALFQKFTNVFILTYRRYLDLKEAEARAEEAVLKSSLDRVRAEIASMRNTDDLQRITPLVWRELRSLGVPFFRCGVFIMDEKYEKVHMYLSTPTGEPLAALDLPFNEKEVPLVSEAIENWHTQTVHRTHWTQQQFRKFTESLKKRGLIKSLKSYQQGETPPENLYLHQVPFKQGMLYVGSSEELGDDQIGLVHSLADAFSVAYARYEDFVQLEEAKKSIENTLAELKSAQNQLIHAEKMASLGELTAGIAHEIQNPLNFVNNFSEVSGELIEELKEEIESGNLEDALEIGRDLIQNIEKINHHGHRASSIVRGMLQHSRASSDEKVSTDINALADEYLRLAYHGFRAKDKSFKANYRADLEQDLPKMNVVPQDIGRVLLNLVNNAFQAVRGREDPEVTVKTQNKDGAVVISVIDNGPGIPENIKEKIFQPFFTTKAAGEGTGLGLSLSYDIVTKGHGGTLRVMSPVTGQVGTEFNIYLPVNH